MTEKLNKKLDRWSSLIRFATPIGVGLILLLQYKFVTKDEIKQIETEIIKINTSVTLLLERERKNDTQDKKIDHLEKKLQQIEIKIAAKR